MAENKKWSQKELVNSWTNAARICILDGASLDNKMLLLSTLIDSLPTGGGLVTSSMKAAWNDGEAMNV